MPDAVLESYVGNYQIAAVGYRRVPRAGSVLYTIRDRNPPLPIRPLSATEFFYVDGTASALRFELDANGKAIAIMVFRRAGGQEERCPRE